MIMRLTALLMTFLGVVGYCPHTVTTVHNKKGISVLQILFNCCYCEGAVSNFLGFFLRGLGCHDHEAHGSVDDLTGCWVLPPYSNNSP